MGGELASPSGATVSKLDFPGTLDCQQAVAVSWTTFARHWIPLLGVLVVLGLPLKLILVVFSANDAQSLSLIPLLLWFCGLTASWTCVWVFWVGPVLTGYFKMMLSALDDDRASIGEILEGLRLFLPAVGAQVIKGFMLGVALFAGFVFTTILNLVLLSKGIAPMQNYTETRQLNGVDIAYTLFVSLILSIGVITVATLFWFVEIALADRAAGLIRAFQLSYRMSVQHFSALSWLMTLLSLPMIPGLLLALLGYGINNSWIAAAGILGVLIPTPWALLATVQAYRQLVPRGTQF